MAVNRVAGLCICAGVAHGAMHIRRAEGGDSGRMANLVRRSFRGDVTWGDSPLVVAQVLQAQFSLYLNLRARLAGQPRKGDALFVATQDAWGDAILGCVDMRLICYDEVNSQCLPAVPATAAQRPHTFRMRPYLSNLSVHPRARRRGIATALVEHCEAQALHWGLDEIVLEVMEPNEAALSLYKKMGYAIEHCDEQGEMDVVADGASTHAQRLNFAS
eukprot:CAMPEP_0185192592 /NCGR_PEP_ID=MMETSP1140-20130426/19445_1 /TAXON_ID=298111 /ORGANISM="Pavlova sp., Strain CCMP459" /LENGTH=216 /DNA_ID=CAMNT_0027759347 /DNA_START=13 /DNA_END=664 /DNA_ORIENTATION=+